MTEQPTCGQGLAEHSVIPAKLAQLTEAVARTLEAHLEALDLTDENARREHEAYAGLLAGHRAAADHLRATSEEMAGYRNLPMGRHDFNVVSSPGAIEAFKAYVTAERDLVDMLQTRLDQDERMLAEMGKDDAG